MLQLALLLLLQAPVEVEIKAREFKYEGNIERASGDVLIIYQDLQIEADTIERDLTTGQVTAGQKVRFRRGEEHLEAESVSINLGTKSGELKNARGQLGPGYFISAEEVHRTEDGRYRLRNATITTCEGPRAGWTFASAVFYVDPKNDVRAKNSIFRLEGIPIFYLPYVIVPTVDRSRSSGFLLPSTSTSTTKGGSLRQSFYWAINRSSDLTMTGEYFTKRGPTAAFDFRAVPNARSSVVINTFFAHDRLGQGGQTGSIRAFTEFGTNNRVVADMNFVSSFDFRQVYEEGLNFITSPIEHSLGFLTSNQPGASLNLSYNRTAIFFSDQLTQSTVVLGKFPAVEALVPERRLGRLPFPVYFSVESGASGIARRDPAIDTPILVERLDLNPSLEIPVLQSSAADWSQRIGIRDTFYTHSVSPEVTKDALNRLSVHYSSRFTGPQFERDFGSFKHVVEPHVDYRYIGGVDRFRRTIVVDEVDLLTNTNEFEYGITNRLFGKHEFFSWRLTQKYFVDPTFGGALLQGSRNVFLPLLDITGFAFADGRRRFSPIVSTMRISTSPSSSADLQVDYDTRHRLFRSAGINGGVSRGPVSGSISYFFTRRSELQEPNNQLRTTIVYGSADRPGFSGAFSLSYDVQRTLFQGSVAQVGYNTDCYGLSLEFMQVDAGLHKESRFRFAFSLKNIGSYGTLRRQERLF